MYHLTKQCDFFSVVRILSEATRMAAEQEVNQFTTYLNLREKSSQEHTQSGKSQSLECK